MHQERSPIRAIPILGQPMGVKVYYNEIRITFRENLSPLAAYQQGHSPTIKTMRSVLTWVAILLIVLWLVGYIGFSEVVGSFIHAALALAFVAILARILTRRRSV